MKVAIIQYPIKWEDVEFNLDRLETKISFVKEDMDLIVLPEMFTTGFSMNTALAEDMNGQTIQWMKRMAKEEKAAILGSIMIKESGKYFNRFVAVTSKGVEAQYDKRHLFSLAKEHLSFQPGNERVIWKYKNFNILLQTCYDLRFPVFSRNNDDYELAVYVANWPQKRATAWNQLLSARAIENQAYVIGCNCVGKDGNKINYQGDSKVVQFDGECLTKLESEQEGILYQTLSMKELKDFRKKFNFLQDRDQFSLNL